MPFHAIKSLINSNFAPLFFFARTKTINLHDLANYGQNIMHALALSNNYNNSV